MGWILFAQVLMVMWSMHASTGSTKLRQTDSFPASLWETSFLLLSSPLIIACNWIGLVLHCFCIAFVRSALSFLVTSHVAPDVDGRRSNISARWRLACTDQQEAPSPETSLRSIFLLAGVPLLQKGQVETMWVL